MSARNGIDFDVIVVGGGLVGACCAALLVARPELSALRIALLESQPPATAPPDTDVDLRVSAISRASENVFVNIDAWSHIPAQHRGVYEQMVVWDAQGKAFGDACLQFTAAETGEPNLGYIIENRRLLWSIYSSRVLRERVSLIRGSLANLQFNDDSAMIETQDGRRLRARLIVAADGAASASRALAGIEIKERDYEQRGIVANVKTSQPHRHTAWQRFLPNGPLALLPLADGRSSIVWSTTQSEAEQLLALEPDAFSRALTLASDHALGEITLDSQRAAFPLKIAYALDYCRERFVLVGDAAHVVHPLAGQGVNLGFMDCATLTQVLAETVRADSSIDAIASYRVLRRYERWRKSENIAAAGLIDALSRTFRSDQSIVGTARRSGMSILNKVPVAKRALIRRALGLSGERPAAAITRLSP